MLVPLGAPTSPVQPEHFSAFFFVFYRLDCEPVPPTCTWMMESHVLMLNVQCAQSLYFYIYRKNKVLFTVMFTEELRDSVWYQNEVKQLREYKLSNIWGSLSSDSTLQMSVSDKLSEALFKFECNFRCNLSCTESHDHGNHMNSNGTHSHQCNTAHYAFAVQPL